MRNNVSHTHASQREGNRVTSLDPKAVALDFVERINSRDPAAIVAAMTPDHEFIDSAGSSITGREAMLEAWSAYFRLFPDYRIEVESVVERGGSVVIVGSSSGTLSSSGRLELAGPDGALPPDEELQGPAIWSGHVRDGLISRWRVLDDTPAVRESLGLSAKQSRGDG
jgi:hypothetical protein